MADWRDEDFSGRRLGMGRRVMMKVVPGQPVDGTGKVCIHLLVRDEQGPAIEPHVLHGAVDEFGNPIKAKLVARPTRMRLACNRRLTLAPRMRNGVTELTLRTEEPSAVTCPKCLVSSDYAAAMSRSTGTETDQNTR